MSFGERDAVTSLLTTLIVAYLFYHNLSADHAAGVFGGADGMQAWARAVLWLIGYSIAIAIAITIVFTIFYVVVTGEKKPSDLRDERDRMIEHRGARIGSALTATGMVAAIVDLAIGASPLHAFTVLLIGCSVSEISKSIFKIFCYRRGY